MIFVTYDRQVAPNFLILSRQQPGPTGVRMVFMIYKEPYDVRRVEGTSAAFRRVVHLPVAGWGFRFEDTRMAHADMSEAPGRHLGL